MNTYYARIAAAGMLLVSTPSMAFFWGAPVYITGYYVYETGDAYLRTSNNQNPDNCSSAAYLTLSSQSAHFKEIYATVMAAQAAGSTVSLNYEGCIGNYPRIASVAVPSIW
jgi:hypothetical protein